MTGQGEVLWEATYGVYNWHRTYIPELGIYTSLDPLFQNPGALYGYAGTNPVWNVDPEGRNAWVIGFIGTYIVGKAAFAGYDEYNKSDSTWESVVKASAKGAGMAVLTVAGFKFNRGVGFVLLITDALITATDVAFREVEVGGDLKSEDVGEDGDENCDY